MKLLSTFSLLLTALTVSANPAPGSYGYKPPCLSSYDAQKIISHWTRAFAGDVSQVKKVAAPGIKIYDNSVNFLFGLPVDTPYVDGIKRFEEAVVFNGATQNNPKFTVVHALNDCKSISFRWTFTGVAIGGGEDACKNPSSTKKGDQIRYHGIDIMIVDPKTKKVTKAYSAFDALNLTYLSGLRTCYRKGENGLPDEAACACPGTCPAPAKKLGGT